MRSKLRVAVVFGGRSGEHEISLLSARSVLDALDRDRYEPVLLGIDHEGRWHLQESARTLLGAPGEPLRLDRDAPGVSLACGDGALVPVDRDEARGAIDVVFPVLHGTYGEDGAIQGLFDMADVAYVGSGVLGSAVGMDKDVAKKLLRAEGVPVVDGFAVRAGETMDVASTIASRWGYPVFVKPANMGSSVGVSKVRDESELAAALEDAFRFDRKVLIERGHRVREVEVAVLGNDHPEASVAGEITPTHEFYSYEAKYLDAEGARLQIPADVDDAQMRALRELAVRTFRALDLSGMARVDFFIDRDDGAVYVNEVNTIPGFTKISMYPKLWEASGVKYPELLDRLIALALERHAARRALSTRYAGASRA
ncbi:MAG: D-alanine--D-alanine ligase family protein [Polyangiales bacterium]